MKFLYDSVNCENPMILIDISKIFVKLKTVDNKSLKPLISRLSDLLEEENQVFKFTILKIFNKFLKNPLRISLFDNYETIKELMKSSNKVIMSLAISILIKIVD